MVSKKLAANLVMVAARLAFLFHQIQLVLQALPKMVIHVVLSSTKNVLLGCAVLVATSAALAQTFAVQRTGVSVAGVNALR